MTNRNNKKTSVKRQKRKPQPIELDDLHPPLLEIERHGKIYGVIFKTKKMYVYFWRNPTAQVLAALKQTVKKVEKFLKDKRNG